ncbi:MAG: hypothetical protein AAGE85_03405 [Pseudomonadota bacterium]
MIIDFLTRAKEKRSAQRLWRERVVAYAQEVNAYIEDGRSKGWEHVGDEPEDPNVAHLVEQAVAAVRRANERNETGNLRDLWPPCHRSLIPLLEQNGQSIPTVCLLDDGSLLARIGAPYEDGRTVRLVGNGVEELPHVGFFGRCPNRRFFAICSDTGVEIKDGWSGPTTAVCRWPTGLEGIPEKLKAEPLADIPTPTAVIPFPDGLKALLVSADGIFVLSETLAVRLLPTESAIEEFAEWSLREHPEDSPVPDLSMEHAAISPSGRLIAAGSQDSTHMVFDEKFTVVADVEPMSEYPHYAIFSADESIVAVNSCHFYNGMTLGIRTDLLPGLKTNSWEKDARIPILEDNARVYAGVSRNDEFIIGDAGGYVRAFSFDGKFRWEIFVGSSIDDIDVSPDRKTLIVSTYAGFISFIELDAGGQPDYQIGTGGHREVYRWLFWKNEDKPLIW